MAVTAFLRFVMAKKIKAEPPKAAPRRILVEDALALSLIHI